MANQRIKPKPIPQQVRPQVVRPQVTPKPVPQQVKPQAIQGGPTYEVLVTAIPNGIQDSWLKLSLVLSPRLKVSSNTTLAKFGTLFTHDWPEFVRSLNFQVFVDAQGGPLTLPTQSEWEFAQPPNNVPPFSSQAWAGIFHDSIPVFGHGFDWKKLSDATRFKVHTFPEKALYESIKNNLYKPTAREPLDQLPSRDVLFKRLQSMAIVEQDAQSPIGLRMNSQNPVRELNRIRGLFQVPSGGSGPQGIKPRGVGAGLLKKRIAAPKVTDQQLKSAAKISRQEFNFLRFRAFDHKFHAPQNKPVPARTGPPTYDFHQILGSLYEYPALARMLGLCVDLRIKLSPAQNIPTPGSLWVRPATNDQAMAKRFLSPKTAYVLGGPTGFMSNSHVPSVQSGQRMGANLLQLQDGMLKLGAKMTIEGRINVPVYDVVPGNVDEVVKRIEVFSSNLLYRVDAKLKASVKMNLSRTTIVPRSVIEKSQVIKRQQIMSRPTTLPAGRSGGLGIAHNTRDEYLDDLLDQSSHNNNLLESSRSQGGRDVVLTGEDLVRGFRIDVREVGQSSGGAPVFTPWRSLNFRHGTYHLLGKNAPPPGAPLPKPFLVHNDEGWISLGMTQEDGDQDDGASSSKRLIVYESLFRWDGWSLCVPRPGRHLGLDDNPNQGTGERMPLVSTMQALFSPVPGTLPRLRFGRQYQFRARVVDLAGNSLAVTDVPSPHPSFLTDINDEDSHYLRMEPVPSPTVLLTAPLLGSQPSKNWPNGEPLSPGEAVDRLVFRSMNVEKPGDPREGLPAGPPPRPPSRHLVPPKSSVELAEQHGMFDNSSNHQMRGSEAYQLMTSKDGDLSDLVPPERRATNGKPGGEFFPEPSVVVPYLPDPMGEGVSCIMYAPGADIRSAPLIQVPFPTQGGWPNVASFRVQLEPGNAPPKISSPNLLQVFVPPGEERILRLSCYLLHAINPQFGNPNRESLFALWRWLEDKTNPQNLANQRRAVQLGRHWMLTPFHEIFLVHATQQPILTPQWVCIEELPETSLGVGNPPDCTVQDPRAESVRHRHYGDTTSTIDGTLAIHRPSTEEIDIQAEWREPIDHPSKPMTSESLDDWLFVKGSAAPFEVKISYVPSRDPGPVVGRSIPEPGEEEEMENLADISDVLLSQPASLEMPVLPEARGVVDPGNENNIAGGAEPIDGKVFERAVPNVQANAVRQPNVGPPPYDERPHRCAAVPPPPPPANYGQRFRFQGLHRFGDTKYRCVSYTAIGTSRYREYFRPMQDEETVLLQNGKLPPRWTRSSPPIMLDILNTAQPEAPKVLYVIPTFKWEASPQGHRRVGGGLRVYLDRPWYSSGNGEQLAVVLYPDARADLPEKAKAFVTQWGLDPLWEDGPRTFNPSASISKQPVPQAKQPVLKPNVIRPRGIPEELEEEVTSRAVSPANLQAGKAQLLRQYGVGISNPTPAHFRNAVAVRHDLGIRETASPDLAIRSRGVPLITIQKKSLVQARPQILSRPPMPVTICAFDVKPDISRQLWYCDIEMDPGTAYFPFVRLALARYQVNSIRGAHLSPVLLADFAQLVPNRTASVVMNPQDPNHALVTVAGVPGTAGSQRQSKIEVEVEESNPAVGGELGWTPVPSRGPTTLPRVNAQQWTGPVALPAPSGKEYRLVIKEYEVFNVPKEADSSPGPRQDERLVYVDALPLNR
jgi:hypothetical protein